MEDLIEKNMGLVLKIVNRFNPRTQTDRDAYIQAGRIGLWKALLKFSKHGGSKFSPYAWNPIKWEIIKEIQSMTPKKDSLSMSSLETSPYQESNDYHSTEENHSHEPFWEMVPPTLTSLESQIIELKLEGYNVKEISTKLQRNRSNIKKNYQSAIGKIRKANDE